VGGLVVEGVGGGPRALEQIVGVARQAAAALVGELVAGQGDGDLLRARVGDPQGPFGAATVGLLLTRLQGLAGLEGVAWQAGLAGIEADLAGRARAFHAGLAGHVNGYGWVRHPATGAPAGGTSQHRHALPTGYAEQAAGRNNSEQPSTSTHPPRRFPTAQEKTSLVRRQYQEARSQGLADEWEWPEANNLTPEPLNRWQQELASRQELAWPQDPAPPPSGYRNSEPGRAVPGNGVLPDVGPVEGYTLDDLPLTSRRYTRQEKSTLLTEYAPLRQGQGTQWLRDHYLTTGQMSAWPRAGEQGRLGEGGLPAAARPPHRAFTIQEKAALVRQYEASKSQGLGEAKAWLEANNLDRKQLRRWRQELASPRAGYRNSEPGRAVPNDVDLPEIGPVEAHAPDDLPLTRRSYTQQEKVTLLTEYAGVDRGQGTQWLRDRRLTTIQMTRWRRAWEQGRLGDRDLPPGARPPRHGFTTQEKAALVQRYQEAKSQGRGEATRWREANNLSRDRLSRWRQELTSRQDPAVPGHGNPEPRRAVPDYLDLPEIGPVEAYTLDDLPRTHRSYTRQEKLALLTEYAHLELGQGSRWLHDRHLSYSLMRDWREAWRKGQLGKGDTPPAARPPRRVFTPQEKATLLRQYREAKSRGPGEARRWLEANNLPREQLSRWLHRLAPPQDPAPPSRHGNPEPGPAVSDYLDLPEIGRVEAYTLDDLPGTRRSYTRQEKVTLLTEYAQLPRGQTSQWLHDHHLTTSQMWDWRRAWREDQLGEGDRPLAARVPRRAFTTQQKAALVQQYQEARSQGPDDEKRWREANNLTRDLLNRWQQQLASRQDQAPPPGDGYRELNMVEVDPAGWEGFPPEAGFQPGGTSTGGGEPSGVNEYLVDPMDTWWATALASATSTPDTWNSWDIWDAGYAGYAGVQCDTGQGTAEPDRHHDGASSSRRSF
jgi:hypothetical protein